MRTTFLFLEEIPDLASAWLLLVEQYQVIGKQVHDARIVALMRSHGIRKIITFNSKDFRRYDDIEILEPSLA